VKTVHNLDWDWDGNEERRRRRRRMDVRWHNSS
jgi:hypothetical protein